MFIATTNKIQNIETWQMPLNHAMLYGSSEFTTMRLSEGKFYFLQEHLLRLKNHPEIKNTLEKIRAHFPKGEWSVRPTIYQNTTELYGQEVKSFFILVKPLAEKINELAPIRLNLVERGQNSRKLFLDQKIGSYFIESQFPNALFHDGIKILESNVANFFFRKKDCYFFPSDSSSIFWGIGAKSCFQYLIDQKAQCYLGSFKLDEIEQMDEAWLINSVRGLQKVTQIGVKKLGTTCEKFIGQYQVNLQESHKS